MSNTGARPKRTTRQKAAVSNNPPLNKTEFDIMIEKRIKSEEGVKSIFENELAKIDDGNLIFTGTVQHEQGYNIYENPNGNPMQGMYYQITIKVIKGLLYITYLIEHPAPLRLVLIAEHSDGGKIPPAFKSRTGSFQTKNGFTDQEINTMGMTLLNSTLQRGFISDEDKNLLTTWIDYGFSNLTFYISVYGAMVSLKDIEMRINPQTQGDLSSSVFIPNVGGVKKSKSKRRKNKSKRRKTNKRRR
jgi:hypothetical protein